MCRKAYRGHSQPAVNWRLMSKNAAVAQGAMQSLDTFITHKRRFRALIKG